MDEKKLLIARGLATGAENLPLLLTGAGAEIVVERVVISGAARVAARAVGRAAEVAGSRAAGVVGKVAEGVAGKLGRFGFLKRNDLASLHSVEEKLPTFASLDLLDSHFIKHHSEFKGAYTTADEYLKGAHDVISHGTKVVYEYKNEARTGYVRFMGNSSTNGIAKFEFVGTNEKGNITTYHIESGKSFWRLLNKNSQNKNIMPHDNPEPNQNNLFKQ